MQASYPEAALRQARSNLIEHGDCVSQGVDERVLRSWRRSLAAGLTPVEVKSETQHAAASALRQALACNHELLSHSQPVMEFLFEQVRHSEGLVVLADQHGTLIHTLGHGCFLGKADRVALSCGASWHEAHRGTNAIGTALAEGRGVAIHGAEHFLERNGFLTCTAAPILSARGDLLGVLDISGDHRGAHPHTLGLVNTAASMIENRLVVANGQRHLRLHFHQRPEGVGSVAEGIVLLSDDGWLVGANRQALLILGLTHGDLGATTLTQLMALSLDEVLARHRRRPGQIMSLRLRCGVAIFAQVQGPPSALTVVAKPPAVIVADALSTLDMGDPRWRVATDKARRVLNKPIPLLIQGESGVGKELFARAAHDSSARRDKPFVAINCAALPESLIEAELFGYAPGAFTGASKDGRLGRLREANGGTLFLDEIGDMALVLQGRLLRVLQEREVTPVGGGAAVRVDFALICATHFRLREEAESGRFRADLYYRINGLTVQLPALRERSDFIAMTQKLMGELNPQREIGVAADVLERLSAYAWPGNLRQYVNVLRTASAMLDNHESCIDWHHLPDDIVAALGTSTAASHCRPRSVATLNSPLTRSLGELSRVAVHQALQDSGGNRSEAARVLGISRQTLYRKLKH